MITTVSLVSADIDDDMMGNVYYVKIHSLCVLISPVIMIHIMRSCVLLLFTHHKNGGTHIPM